MTRGTVKTWVEEKRSDRLSMIAAHYYRLQELTGGMSLIFAKLGTERWQREKIMRKEERERVEVYTKGEGLREI